MTNNATRNWFDQGGHDYARFRPAYPPELAAWLASSCPDRILAVDVGCGSGQLTHLLAPHFQQTIGLDPSASQLAHTPSQARIDYRCAPAERLPLPDASASLVTAAQAAHWFDLPAFYAEARRVAKPGAVVALVTYGIMQFEPALNDRFQDFYWHEIGPYWPPERKLVDTGYATIGFPFAEFAPPPMAIRVEWRLAELFGYLQTWSAVRSAREHGRKDLLDRFAADLEQAWGDPERMRPILWPIHMRIGRC